VLVRNLLVLGCGRSGTSMVAGTLAGAGYFMGERLHAARDSNPKGFYESAEINQINEAILAQVLPQRPTDPVEAERSRHIPVQGQRWLAQVPLGVSFPALSETVEQRILRALARAPYCFKDPRFSYTLPVWRPFLRNTAFVCVFRHPAVVAESILKECRDTENMRSLAIDHDGALRVWALMYQHVLKLHRYIGDWLFVEYNQLFEPGVARSIAGFVEAPVDTSFPDSAFNRSRASRDGGGEAMSIYRELADLAGYQPPVTTLGSRLRRLAGKLTFS
jgi:hypothetical protein